MSASVRSSKMLLTSLMLLAGAPFALAECKCNPIDDCWPSPSKWNALNTSVDGQLIYNQPIAKPCYPGSGYDTQLYQDISEQWTESPFQELSLIGYTYSTVNTCSPINAHYVNWVMRRFTPSARQSG
ncbi:uncharacterized protein ACHE_10615A [Aspergillus chevalieri]|uniref:Uncharacterized protein n=1 Tax=Aspergillus chevalieri TaxID=182096 RepID=A0A7R7VG66_ASPCH|nr:uncharacterized protein ACHE_10615A [Aspergillus chevalieri]BCR83213.1 hypothetical protein ACHE_10615A [Aspergillus chevalieri]